MTSLELLRLLQAVPAARNGLQRAGGQWKCRCPAHRDNVSSLAIKVGQDGKLLLTCHAGCSTQAVLDAWGVGWSVLFPDQPQPPAGNGTGPSTPAQATSSRPQVEPEAVYDYLDAEGRLLFQVCRFPGKRFKQRRPLTGGGWAWNLQHTARVLYRLPELLARPQEPVWLVEGEKDADRLLGAGLLATTAPGGAGKWRPEYAEALRGRSVVILPDNDEPGRQHAETVATALEGVATVKTLHLDGLPLHGDVSAYMDKGGSADQLRVLAEKVVSSPSHIGRTRDEKLKWTLVGAETMLTEPEDEPPDLVVGMLPAAGLSIVGAKPKVGKSTLVRCLALAVAQGGEFLERTCEQGPVIYLALEEKRREVINHFKGLGLRSRDPLYCHFGAAPDKALEGLVELIEQHRPRLVVIDPLFRFVRVKDVAAYAEITNALAPVLEAARATSCHLMLVHHNGKAERELGDDLLGSTAIFGSVDTALILRRRQGGLRYAYSIQRYGVDLPETVLELRGSWIMPAGSPDLVELTRIKARVLEFLAENPASAEPLIREHVEGKGGVIGKALRHLLNDGRTSRSGTGKRGDPYLYSLVTVEPTTPASHDGEQEVCPACQSPEREPVIGTGKVPSWKCLGCGQLYGQLPLEGGDTGDTRDAGDTGDKKDNKDEGDERGQQGQETRGIPRCPTCGHTVTVRYDRKDDGWCQECHAYVTPSWGEEQSDG